MTELEKRGNRVASIGTAVLFAVFIILSLCLKFKPKDNFETIYIQLDSTPVVKNEPKQTTEKSENNQKSRESAQAPSPAPAKVEATAKVEPKKESKPAPAKAEPKKDPAPAQKPNAKAAASSSSSPSKAVTPTAEGPKIKKSMDELMAEMTAKKPSQQNDYTQDYESSEQEFKPEVSKSSTPSSTGLSGSAASSSKSADTSAASSSAENSPDRSQSASSSTSQALAGIKDVVYFAKAGSTVGHTQITESSSSSSGELSMKMTDGSTRQLLNPKSPAIRISEENAKLIDTTRNVSIEFIVNPDGTVPYNSIEIVPAAALPSPIQQEIRNQLMNWLFSKGGTNRAVFKYTLQVN
ncbi:MAG: hypothetical protein MJZ50_01935 [Treponema sp.]|nr:hypothetical protein [Treponema sp.]